MGFHSAWAFTVYGPFTMCFRWRLVLCGGGPLLCAVLTHNLGSSAVGAVSMHTHANTPSSGLRTCTCRGSCLLLTPRSPPMLQVPAPDAVRAAGYDSVQFTLVDCPGHASLIRTVIGGAQIIDLMLLVVDITKGGLGRHTCCL